MKYQKILVDSDNRRIDGKDEMRLKQKDAANALNKKFKSWKK